MADARARSAAREDADRRATQAASDFARLEAELEATRGETLSATSERVAAANGRHAMEVEASRADASLARLTGELARLDRDLAQREEEVAGAERERDHLAARAADARRRLEGAEADAAGLEASIEAADARREAARDALGTFAHRLAALAELARRDEDHADGGAAGARLGRGARPRNASRSGSGLSPAGKTPRTSSSARTSDALFAPRDAVAAPRRDGSAVGRTARLRRLVGHSRHGPRWSGALGGWEVALADYARLSPAEQAALPPVDLRGSLDRALALSERHPAAVFATRKGEVVRGSLVRLAPRQAGPSGVFSIGPGPARARGRGAMRRASRWRAASGRSSSCAVARRERDEVFTQTREEAHRDESALSSLHARVEERRNELERTRRERETVAAELGTLQEHASAIGRSRDALGADERRHAAREESARQRVDALAARLPELRSLAMSAAEELAHRRTEAEVAAERRRSFEQAREKLLEARGAVERRTSEAAEQGRQLAVRAEEIAQEEAGGARTPRRQPAGPRRERLAAGCHRPGRGGVGRAGGSVRGLHAACGATPWTRRARGASRPRWGRRASRPTWTT